MCTYKLTYFTEFQLTAKAGKINGFSLESITDIKLYVITCIQCS